MSPDRSVALALVLGIGFACAPRPRPKTTTAVTPVAHGDVAPNNKSSEAALALPSLSERLGPDFSLGVAVEPYLLKEQGDVIAKHFRRVVTENAMKWGEICRAPGRCDFQRADAVAAFARANQMKMTGHTFVWHQMYPAWLFKDGKSAATRDVLTERLRAHIFQLVERYADVVDNWDVANEVISDKPGQMWRQLPEPSKWYEAFGGEGYVETAFRLAAEATAKFAPQTKLYYNDYSIENPEKRKKVIEMIRGLRKKGVRIDGVGIQAHINLDWPSAEELGRAIDEFAAEQLLVKVSELDISIYTTDDFDGKRYQKELNYDPGSNAAWPSATSKSSTCCVPNRRSFRA